MSVSSIARISKSLQTVALATAAMALAACGPGGDGSSDVTNEVVEVADAAHLRVPSEGTSAVTLRLDDRAGQAKLGWSLQDTKLVTAADADITLSSSDCGARGRWVTLDGDGIQFCQGDPSAPHCGWSNAIEVGGSNPAVDVGATFVALRDGVVIANVTLVDRTETLEGWYNEEPIAPFVVEIDIELVE